MKKPWQARIDAASVLPILAFSLQICFLLPLQVVVRNRSEFGVDLPALALGYLVLALLASSLLYGLSRLARSDAFTAVVFALATLVLLESRFFLALARHDPFDGSPVDWDSWRMLAVAEVIAAVGVAVFALGYRHRGKIISSLSVFILLLAGGGLVLNLTTHSYVMLEAPAETKDARYFEQFYRLSRSRNVIHIVADQTQGAMLHEIFEDSPEYRQAFDGFTLFSEGMGRYQSTYPNVVFYMTGEAPEPKEDVVLSQPFTWDYVREALKEKSIVAPLKRAGFDTFAFTFSKYLFCHGGYTACTGSHDEVFAGVAVKTPAERYGAALLAGLDVALFQSTPVVLRRYVYADGKWLLRRALDRNSPAGILELFLDQMTTDERAGSYNHFHLGGAHAPLLFDRDCNYVGPQTVDVESEREQLRCTVEVLAKMIGSLKRLGVYDRTLIVVHGDHGTPWLPEALREGDEWTVPERVVGWANTALLVKPLGARGPLEVSRREVSIGDVPASIAREFGLAETFPGRPVFDQEAVARERSFFTYDRASEVFGLQELPNMERYRVVGSIHDSKQWILPHTERRGLRIADDDFELRALGFGPLARGGEPFRWVVGKRASVSLSPPGTASCALVFEGSLPPLITDQAVAISIDSRLVEELDDSELRTRRHEVPVPQDLCEQDRVTVQFEMSHTYNTAPGDPRELAMVFFYIDIEPSKSPLQ